MNNDLQAQVQRINEKLQLLLKQHVHLQKEKEILQHQLQDVKKLNDVRGQELDALSQKLSVLKSATNNLSEQDKKELEKRLNHYVKEIDRCITLLSA